MIIAFLFRFVLTRARFVYTHCAKSDEVIFDQLLFCNVEFFFEQFKQQK